ncbi:SpvB/TcaC N-terminal domain-containing protein, partial [Chryseobacterium sp.]|uniref:SpvB/TcaC N-terminal domain-containing protein n=1 Tax=Chryseobacterium sp. TaxID=1871047 RepID=UPI0025C347FC
ILYQPETSSRTVQDPQAIILAPGFYAKADTSNPFIAKIGPATQNSGGGPIDSDAGSGNPSGTTAPSGQSFHDTKGNIEVNGSGQLQFTLPIALPPGVKSVAPQISLVYSSGSGNGIAGYGWNLSGITSISRTGKNIEKDGEVKAVQLDYSDYYMFNGQRLILKSGEYGKDGAEYVTEKYSNVKIKSVGSVSAVQPWQGPEYWEVTFEDGSQAWYGGTASGNSSARTPIEYNIVKWRDAQGNYITYNYSQSGNVSSISSIQWGGNESLGKVHFNEIIFNYQERKLIETSYLNEHLFVQKQLLNNIVVNTNNALFKKYEIKYAETANGYQFVDTLTEYNAENIKSNPVVFGYKENAASHIEERGSINYSKFITFGDFDGNGILDGIYKRDPGKLCLEWAGSSDCDECYTYCTNEVNTIGGYYLKLNNLKDAYNTTNEYYLGDDSSFEKIKTLKYKNSTGNLEQGEFLYIYKEETNSQTNKKNLVFYYYKLDLSKKVTDYTSNQSALILMEKKVYDGSSIFINDVHYYDPNTSSVQEYTDTETTLGKSYEMDIDGDGLSELIIEKNYKKTRYNMVMEGEYSPYIYYYVSTLLENKDSYLIVQPYLNSNLPSEITFPDGKKISEKAKWFDFDGDGIIDIGVKGNTLPSKSFSYTQNDENGYPQNVTGNIPVNEFLIYGIRKILNGNFEFYLKRADKLSGHFEDGQFGDFNGDGLVDWITYASENIDNYWVFSLNTGKGFNEQIRNDLVLKKNFTYKTNTFYIQQKFKVLDINNDGKSDLISLYYNTGITGNNEKYSKVEMNISYNLGEKNGMMQFGNYEYFTKRFSSLLFFDELSENIKFDFERNSLYIIANGENASNYGTSIVLFSKDNIRNNAVVSISQGGKGTDIDYKELDPDTSPGSYAPIKKEQYPYMELDRLSQTYAVSQLRQEGRKQDFRFRGMISHLQGRGVIGFRQSAKSSWYADGFENTKIWSGAETDPLNDGLPIKEWSVRTNNENLIFPADLSENNSQLISFKSTVYQTDQLLGGQLVTSVASTDKPKVVKAILPKNTRVKDFLTGRITESSITYGNYYLPTQTLSTINDGYAATTSTFEYVHNPSGTGAGYYIGRPKSKTDVVQAYSDTKSAKEEYTYENNLLKTQKNWNRDNTGSLQTTYNYDGFGNITQKTTGNSVDSQTQTTKAEYDGKGRFVVKKTDNLGLETNITYNDWGQVTKQTDPLGNTLENEYDGWGKLMKSKTNLEGTTSYQYERDNNSNITVTQYDSDGDISKKYANKLGQEYKVSSKALGQEKYISKETQYDILGRKLKESEAYFEGQAANGWNTITYDDSVFPAKITATAFNGKQMETSISGNITTVKELNGYGRTTSKTTDALGNVISTTDKGGSIQFSYNAAGEQTKAQYAGNTVTTAYDAWGRKSEFNDPSNGIYKYEYDGFGQPKKIISPKGAKEYIYNNLGQLISQKELSRADGGKVTSKLISFTYDDKGRLISKSGTSKGESFSSSVAYDPQGRLLSSSESSNGKYFIQKGITYDDKARVVYYEKQLYSSGVLTKVQIENVYSTWNGELYQIKDKITGKSLWQLKEANAKGQVLKAKLGAVDISNVYDNNGFLTNVNHSSAVKPSILQLSYSFDAIKNELKSRTTGGDFNITESFDYDDNNRLVNWTNPVTGVKPSANRNVYDVKGRILENDQVGKIKFENAAKIYQPTGMTLNATGTPNYTNDLIQSISYNENNDPVFIDGENGDVVFRYGLTAMRQRVTYGGNFSADGEGKFTKFYSEDGSYEIVKDNTTGKEK